MKLLQELVEDVAYIAEGAGAEKKHFIEGIFLQSNIKNKNGRIYPKPVMEREVSRYVKDVVEDNRGWGELSHPQGPAINGDRISHRIISLKESGNNYIGKALITETPMGKIVVGLMDSGGKLGVSSRGLGSLKALKEGIMEVQDDFKLVTAADVVTDPSAPDAFISGVMESAEFIWDPIKGSWIEEHLHNLKTSIKKMKMDEIEEKKLSIFENYLLTLMK